MRLARLYIILSALLMPFYGSAAEASQRIVFFRPSFKGQELRCVISIQRSEKYVMTSVGGAIQEKKLKSGMDISGLMTVSETSESGQASKVEFEVDKAAAVTDGVKMKLSCAGRTLLVDMSVSPVCGFSFKSGKENLSDKEKRMLSMVFRPQSPDTLDDLMGIEREVAPGDSWPAPKEPLLKMFRAKHIDIEPERIEGTVKLVRRENFKGIECWRLEEQLVTKGIPDLSFSFRALVLLPVAQKHPAVCVRRKGVQRVVKRIEESSSDTAGIKMITIVIEDEMSGIFLPAGGSAEAENLNDFITSGEVE